MNRQYLRYLLLVLLGLAATVWLADQVYLNRQQQAPAPEAVALQQLLNGYCRENTCSDERAPWVGIRFLPEDQLILPPTELERLNTGNLIRAESGTGEFFFYVRVGELIGQLGPFKDRLSDTHTWYTRAFYVFLAIAIVLCFWPPIRDLQKLKDAAARFARDRNPQHFKFSHSSFYAPVSDAMIWMSQRLARSVALQQELSATLSHELRTPISRLKFAVATLSANHDARLKYDMQEDLEELEQLVEEYLTFARQEHERPLLDFAPVPLLDLISPRLHQLAKISGRQTELLVTQVVVALADRRSLVRAFNNLIENGIKYSRSQVRIHLYLEGRGAVFVIEDDGPGLEGLALDDIFLPYVRENQMNKISGYGLGLAIVRKIVDWHGGRIAVGVSEQLGGARFELWLPAAAETNRPQPPEKNALAPVMPN